jgi:multicomponent Na+:H+ antiporter subunit G
MAWAGVALVAAGMVFFTAGTAGLLRFPDGLSRLHALPKADNLGLGLTALGMALQSGSVAITLKLLLIWGLTLVASAACAYLIGARDREEGGLPLG